LAASILGGQVVVVMENARLLGEARQSTQEVGE